MWLWVSGAIVLLIVAGVVVQAAVRTSDAEESEETADGLAAPISIAGLDASHITFRGETLPVSPDQHAVDLRANAGAPSLVTVATADGTYYEAIVLTLEGVENNEVSVNADTTAFARLVTTPPLLTADPLALVGIRMMVSELESYSAMVAAVEDQDGNAIDVAHAAVIDDLVEEVDSSGLAGPTLEGARRGFGFGTSGTEGSDLECPSEEPTGEYGLCIRATQDGDVTLVNRSRHWRAVVESAADGSEPAIVALVPPKYHALTGGAVDFLAVAARSLTTKAVDSVTDFLATVSDTVCDTSVGSGLYKAISFFGLPNACEMDQQENARVMSDVILAFTGGRVDEVVLDPEGEAFTRVSQDSTATAATMVAWGHGPDVGDIVPSAAVGHAEALVVTLDVVNSVVEPIVSLVLGVSGRSAEGQLALTINPSHLLSLGSALSDPAIATLVLQLREAESADDKLFLAQTSYDLGYELLNNRALWESLQSIALSGAMEMTEAQIKTVVSQVGRKAGLEVLSKTFVVIDVVDRVAQGAGTVIHSYGFGVELARLPGRVAMPPLHAYLSGTPDPDWRASLEPVLPVTDLASWTAYLDVASFENPPDLTWASDYPVYDIPIPFMPDGDYQGSGSPAEYVDDDMMTDGVVYGVAPPFFPGMESINLADSGVQNVGPPGATVRVQLIPNGVVPYESSTGDLGAWVIAAVESDMHSKNLRWAVCRFHLNAESPAVADAVFCSQADDGYQEGASLAYSWVVADDGTLREVSGGPHTDFVWGTRYIATGNPYVWDEEHVGVARAESDGYSSGDESTLDPAVIDSPTATWQSP